MRSVKRTVLLNFRDLLPLAPLNFCLIHILWEICLIVSVTLKEMGRNRKQIRQRERFRIRKPESARETKEFKFSDSIRNLKILLLLSPIIYISH